MTLKELKRQIDAAKALPLDETWNALPRVYYKDLPARLKREAEIPLDKAKRFLYECYPVGTYDKMAADETAFNEKIVEALHAARYLITSVDTHRPAATTDGTQVDIDDLSPVSLIGADFIEAWEKITGLAPVIIPNTTFSTIRQGTATNALTKIRALQDDENGNTGIDKITGAATIRSGSGLALILPDFSKIGSPTTSTWQLLDIITVNLTENGAKSPRVQMTLDEYMDKRGLKDRKEARKQLTKDLELLRVAAITFQEPRRKGEPVEYYNLNISSGAGMTRTGFVFDFSDKFFSLLLGYPVMPYPPQLYTLNSKRNPNSFYFLRKIAEHKNMNIGKQNEDTIAVKTLVAASPFLPSYRKVMATDRHLDTRIIAPFERDMDVLSDTIKWEYCHSNREPLTPEELSNFSYQTFKDCLVHITWIDYPDQSARLKRIEEQRATKAKRGRPRNTRPT